MTSEETLSNNNKYNQKLQHIYVMTKWMVNNYFFVIKSRFVFYDFYFMIFIF